MRGNFFLTILFGVILLAGVVVLGVYIYNAGMAQGIATGGSLTAPDGEGLPLPYYYPHLYRPWGFGFFGWIFPLLFILLFFAAVRGLFFRRGHHHGHWGGYPSRDYEGQNIPPVVEEWHRKMHSGEDGPGSPAG